MAAARELTAIARDAGSDAEAKAARKAEVLRAAIARIEEAVAPEANKRARRMNLEAMAR